MTPDPNEAASSIDIGRIKDGATPTEMGRIVVDELWTGWLLEHPNSTNYKSAMQTLQFMAGFRAGKAGIDSYDDLLEFQRGIIARLREKGREESAPQRA